MRFQSPLPFVLTALFSIALGSASTSAQIGPATPPATAFKFQFGAAEPAPVSARLAGTIATNVLALERGASVFRVHDVGPVREALTVAAATLGGRWTARGTGTTPAS